jgi:hypothetical protein
VVTRSPTFKRARRGFVCRAGRAFARGSRTYGIAPNWGLQTCDQLGSLWHAKWRPSIRASALTKGFWAGKRFRSARRRNRGEEAQTNPPPSSEHHHLLGLSYTVRDIPRPASGAAKKMTKRKKPPSPSRFSLLSASPSPVSSVYYVTFLAIAIISMAQLRGVYESSIGLSFLLSPASSSASSAETSSASGLEQDPYYAAILAHLLAPTAPNDADDDPVATGASEEEEGEEAYTATKKAGRGGLENQFSGDSSNEEAGLVGVEAVPNPNSSADGEVRRRYYLDEGTNAKPPEAFDPVELVPDDAVEEIQVAEPVASSYRDDDAGDDDGDGTGDEFTVTSPDKTSDEGDGEEVTSAVSTKSLEEAIARIVEVARMPSQQTNSSGVVLASNTEESSSPLKEAVGRIVVPNSSVSAPTKPGGTTNDVYYSVARTDRAGATIRDMVVALAYGYAHNKTYGGACYVNPMRDAPSRQADKEALIRSVGLQEVLKFACPDSYDEGLLQQEDYASTKQRNKLVNPAFVNWLRSKVVLPDLSAGSGAHGGDAVVHVRRGDVDPCNEWADRYLPNSYYQEVLRKYVPRNARVSVFSESWSFEPWTDFPSPRHKVFLDTDLAEVWRAVMSAQYVVLSLSSFVYIPAILNPKATVLYAPTWQFVPMPHWIKVGMGIRRRSDAKVKALAEAKCATHESLLAGTSMGRGARNQSLIRTQPPVVAEGK